jgi:integrase
MTTRTKKSDGAAAPLRVKKNRSANTCYATFNGGKVWFGREDDPETRVRYASYVAAWEARGRQPEPEEQTDGVTVRELVERRRRGIEEQKGAAWFNRNGTRFDLALQPLLDAHGDGPAAEFSPLNLKAIRFGMIHGGRLCASEINARIGIIKAAFRWAVSEELVPASIQVGLETVGGLGDGDFGTRGSKARAPVAEDVVRATLLYLHPVAAAIVELLWWTGARPAEVFDLRPQDIETDGPAWCVTVKKHKTARFGKVRFLGLGPRAQEILRRFLDRVPRPAKTKPIFAPAMSMTKEQARARDRAPTDRRGRSRKLSDRYDAGALRTAISRAVTRANRDRAEADKLPQWTPYQLRHSALTRIRRERNEEDAALIAGHARKSMTDHYTVDAIRERVLVIAAEVA